MEALAAIQADRPDLILLDLAMPVMDGFAVLKHLKAAGFVIYAGQGQLDGAVFRIATMGDLRDADIDALIAAYDQLWRRRRA